MSFQGKVFPTRCHVSGCLDLLSCKLKQRDRMHFETLFETPDETINSNAVHLSKDILKYLLDEVVEGILKDTSKKKLSQELSQLSQNMSFQGNVFPTRCHVSGCLDLLSCKLKQRDRMHFETLFETPDSNAFLRHFAEAMLPSTLMCPSLSNWLTKAAPAAASCP
mmetsp:Transcript_34871/g.84838  ORF Transcript_34871/g.84838 Transcript_34871/m.84838 type:complete len:165 (-) Transcript_34871:1358-1852(-)